MWLKHNWFKAWNFCHYILSLLLCEPTEEAPFLVLLLQNFLHFVQNEFRSQFNFSSHSPSACIFPLISLLNPTSVTQSVSPTSVHPVWVVHIKIQLLLSHLMHFASCLLTPNPAQASSVLVLLHSLARIFPGVWSWMPKGQNGLTLTRIKGN